MFHIIINPVAGKKRAKKNLKVVEACFQERGVAYEVHETCAKRDAESIAYQLTSTGKRNLIVMGGDGSLHEVLNGLDDPSKCCLGLIPSGTGNDFADSAKLSLDAKKAVSDILDNEPTEIDYIQVGDRRCMNVGGFGMDVDVLERCERGKMKGKLKYLASLLKSLFAFKGCKLTIEKDGEKIEHSALIATVCNGAKFGGGIKICPAADVADKKMDVVIVDCIGGKWGIIKAFLKLMKGRILEYPLTTYYQCDEVTFTPSEPCTMQLDGELYKNLTFHAKLCSGLKFYLGKKAGAGTR